MEQIGFVGVNDKKDLLLNIAKVITKLNKNTYSVSGGKLKRLVAVTDIKNIQQVRRLSNIMDSMGVWAALKNLGINNEDTVIVEGMEMIYVDEYFGE